MPIRAVHRKLKEFATDPDKPVSVTEFATYLNMPLPEVEKHLAMLSDMNFVELAKGKVFLTMTGFLANLEDVSRKGE
jgi:DNA-binding IscR family transcriptional regulator